MKKIIYFLCCILSVCACVYMFYVCWLKIDANIYNMDTLVYVLAAIGWGHITYRIIMKEYKWTSYLCK